MGGAFLIEKELVGGSGFNVLMIVLTAFHAA
jgi:hypothetical protein